MSTQETTTKAKPAKAKKAKASEKTAKAKATKAKNAATPKKATKPTKAKAAKSGSKTAIVLNLMRRKDGATLAEIAKATNWQNHSIRGFVSGHVTKKLKIKVESTKSEAGARTYRIVN